MMRLTARPASVRLWKVAVAVATARGRGLILSTISVTTPSIPSEPTKRWVRSKPELLFMVRVPVRITGPSPRTTLSPST